MRKNHLYKLLICCFIFSITRSFAQTTTGSQQTSAVINFTQLAQYYTTHPQPLQPNLMPEPDDEGRPTGRPAPNPTEVHMRASAPSTYQSVGRLALLPASPAPTDSFESTLSNGTAIPPEDRKSTRLNSSNRH